MIDSVFRIGKNYYPEVFLEEFKYLVKEKKMLEYITFIMTHLLRHAYYDIDISCDDSNEKDSDEENSNQENKIKNSFVYYIWGLKLFILIYCKKKLFYLIFSYLVIS